MVSNIKGTDHLSKGDIVFHSPTMKDYYVTGVDGEFILTSDPYISRLNAKKCIVVMKLPFNEEA